MNDNTLKGNKKAIISTAIGIVSMILLIVGATYAYWNAKGSVNFNTATITYETEDKSIIVLNGTTGLLTLGTIEGTDMPKISNNIVYYAGEEDKSRTPQEVTIGVATYDEEDDENIYRCTFTLALTHGGSADLIDRFLSEGYTNRSAGQIIITVNGVEYDINDGFPNSITGYTDVDIYHPGSINVGMKFVNIGTLNQDYLIETNGHININVTSFNCQAKKELASEEPTVKYWAALKEKNQHLLGVKYSTYTNFYNAKKYDDYHDLINTTMYGVTTSNTPENDFILFSFINEFETLTTCENFIEDFPDYDFLYAVSESYNFWECEYDSDNDYYKIIWSNVSPISSNYNDGKLALDSIFESIAECEEFIDLISLYNNFIGKHTNISYDANTLSCSPITINWQFFVRETKTPIESNADKWEFLYTSNVYRYEDECLGFLNYDPGFIDPNNKSYCLNSNGYYLLQHHLKYEDVKYDLADYPELELSKVFGNRAESVLFDSESDCQNFASSYLNSIYRGFEYYDSNYDYVAINVNPVDECVQTRTRGETYYEYKLEMCLYKNNKLVCIDINDDAIFNSMDELANEINAIGYDAESSTESQGENRIYNGLGVSDDNNSNFGMNIDGDYNWYGDTGIELTAYNWQYTCQVNQIYGDMYSTRCAIQTDGNGL